MEKQILKNWFKIIIALSLFIFSCGFFILSININKVYAGDTNQFQQSKTCVGAVIDKLGNISTIWSDGTVK
jgi:hypothetical protein